MDSRCFYQSPRCVPPVSWLISAVLCGLLTLSVPRVAASQVSSSPAPTPPIPAARNPALHLRLVVRYPDGNPVIGLSSSDFAVGSGPDAWSVLQAHNFADSRPPDTSSFASGTYLLLIVPPMTLAGRNLVLRSALAHLEEAAQHRWSIAVLDASGNFAPFTTDIDAVRATLHQILATVDTPQYGTKWLEIAHRAMRSLANCPGRHVVIVPDDESLQTSATYAHNLDLLRVSPYSFETEALDAVTQEYPIETGPGLDSIIPFGEASAASPRNTAGTTSPSSAAAGQQQLASVLATSEAQGWAWAVRDEAANMTGGRSEDSINHAFYDIAQDGAGTYDLLVLPPPGYGEAGVGALSIHVNRPHARVVAPALLQTPGLWVVRGSAQLDPHLHDLLSGQVHATGLGLLQRAWYFPQSASAPATMVFATQLADATPPPSPIPFASQLALDSDNAAALLTTWQGKLARDSTALTHAAQGTALRAFPLRPGSYIYRTAAYDAQGQRGGIASMHFAVNVPDPDAFLGVSSLLLWTACAPPGSIQEDRPNLFNPLRQGECEIIPALLPTLRTTQPLHVLLRLYPGLSRGNSFPKHWSAAVTISDLHGVLRNTLPAEITPSTRGWEVNATLKSAPMSLAPGRYRVAVTLSGPHKRQFSVEDAFLVPR